MPTRFPVAAPQDGAEATLLPAHLTDLAAFRVNRLSQQSRPAGAVQVAHQALVGRAADPRFITVVIYDMAHAHSKLTSQGQISVPARIRQKLGLGPGAVLEWDDSGDDVLVRRVGRYTSEEIHQSLFPTPPRARTVAAMKDGIRRHIQGRRAIR